MARNTPVPQQEVGNNTYWILGLICFVVIVGLAYCYLTEESRNQELGSAFCGFYNLTYDHISGEHIHCYRQDNKTAVRQEIDVWVDFDLAKELYLNKTG